MRYLSLTLCLCGSLYSQSLATWWSQADSSQKAFAEKCYEFGKQYGRGHTLAAIAWMESSLGADTAHKEDSYGCFGVSKENIKSYGRNDHSHALDVHIPAGLLHAQIAIKIFEDNIRYFRRLGYSEREAYFWAYPRYNAGKKWRRFRRRGEVFRMRVRFLVKEFK